MTYVDWFALATWCACFGFLLLLWGIEEIKYALVPSKYADLAMLVALKTMVLAITFGWHSMYLLSESCDVLPNSDPACLMTPSAFAIKGK